MHEGRDPRGENAMQLRICLRSLAFGLCLAFYSASSASAVPNEGDIPPSQVGKTIDGKAVSLNDYSGKVVVLSYWATWCTYCRSELKVLEKLQNLVSNQQLQVIAVNIESRDVFRHVLKTLKGFSMLLAYDPGNKCAKAYDVVGLPYMVIVGRDGRVVSVNEGYGEGSLDGIIADVNLALKAPVPAPTPTPLP
jgi:peroxiredoxin